MLTALVAAVVAIAVAVAGFILFLNHLLLLHPLPQFD
jgi:hypothetical protein